MPSATATSVIDMAFLRPCICRGVGDFFVESAGWLEAKGLGAPADPAREGFRVAALDLMFDLGHA